jgi:hypothetical protein
MQTVVSSDEWSIYELKWRVGEKVTRKFRFKAKKNNGELPLCLTKHIAMKTYGEWMYSFKQQLARYI